jgi:hypothetical protein
LAPFETPGTHSCRFRHTLLRGSVPVVFGDKPPNGIKVFHRLRRESKRRIHPRRFNRSVRCSRNISTAASPSSNSPRSA